MEILLLLPRALPVLPELFPLLMFKSLQPWERIRRQTPGSRSLTEYVTAIPNVST